MRACTLAANSATVNPLGAGASARAARSASRMRGLLRSTPPTRVAPSRTPVGSSSRMFVADESGVHTIQGGGESLDDAGQPGDDLGELLDHPAAAQLRGVVHDRLESQHAFALSVLRTPVKVGIRCCLRCLASFRHPCLGAADRSRGRGGAPAAQRGRATSRPARIRRKLGRPGARQRRCGSSHLLPPGEKNVLRETTSHVPAPSLIWVHGRGPAT